MAGESVTGMQETHRHAATGVILIIDDDEIDRMACRRMLLKERFSGFRIVEAALGLEGIRMAEKEQPDVVLLDYRLPDDDGINILRMMNSAFDAGPAVVMMTGARDLEIAVDAMRLGARDYLVKDPDKNYLALLPEIIDRIMRERILRQQKHRRRMHCAPPIRRWNSVCRNARPNWRKPTRRWRTRSSCGGAPAKCCSRNANRP